MKRNLLMSCVLICAVLGASGCHDTTRETSARAVDDIAAAGVVGTTGVPRASEDRADRPDDPVGIEMNTVRFRAAEDVVLSVEWLGGRLISTVPHKPTVFDDPSSFQLQIQDAELKLTPANLTALVNRAFDYEGTPLSNLVVSTDGNRLKQHGTLHKGLPIPFSVVAEVAAAPDGRLRLHPVKVTAAGIPAKRLMSMLSLELDDLIGGKRERGISVDGNDLLLEVGRMLPGTQIRGRLSRVYVQDDQLVQIFGRGAARRPSSSSSNYVWFRGGQIRFGKLTMTDADLQLVDADPRDPFDFFPARYNAQLVAGYSRNTPNLGLKTYMPDFDDLSRLPHGKLPPPPLSAPSATR